MATQLKFWGLKSMGVPQPQPVHGFSPNFQDMFTPRGSRADCFLGGYLATTVAMDTLVRFLCHQHLCCVAYRDSFVLSFCGGV